MSRDKKPRVLPAGYELGKIPPQAIELEESVLGGLMLEKENFDKVTEILSPECFYKEAHGLIYQTIYDLVLANEPVDILTVSDSLRKASKLEVVGGAYYITELTRRVASTANIQYHAYIVKEKHILREMIRISGLVMEMAFDDSSDFTDTIDAFEAEMQPIRDFLGGISPYTPWNKLLDSENERIKIIASQKSIDLLGANTGSETLNRVLGGFRNSNLIIVAARPGIGKSTKSLSFAKAAALTGKPAVIFSLEMTADQLIRKFIIEESEVFSSKFLLGNLSDEDLRKIDEAVEELKKLPIDIIDKSGIKPMYAKSVIRKIKKKRGSVGLVVIDYLQLMNSNVSIKGNREQEIGNISKSLKELAKEEDIPVIALSQLSRDLEKRGNKRPLLSDLRESGSIEQDADVVLMLYSPCKYYHEKLKDPDYKDNDMTQEVYEELMETWIMKNRHGAADILVLERFNKALGKFTYYNPNNEVVNHISVEQDTSWQQGRDLFSGNFGMKEDELPF